MARFQGTPWRFTGALTVLTTAPGALFMGGLINWVNCLGHLEGEWTTTQPVTANVTVGKSFIMRQSAAKPTCNQVEGSTTRALLVEAKRSGLEAPSSRSAICAGGDDDVVYPASRGAAVRFHGRQEPSELLRISVGLYENTLLFADQHIPYGNATSNTRPGQALFPTDVAASTDYHYNAARALFLGAQAGVIAFGRSQDWPMRVKWLTKATSFYGPPC